MSIQSGRSLLSLLLFTQITASPSGCPTRDESQKPVPSPRAIHMASSRSMVFEFDGQHISPTRLQNMQAELLSRNGIGEFILPKPRGKELYIVFRDRRRQADTIYRVSNGSGEIMYVFNNGDQMWVMTADRQPIIEVSNGRLWSIDIYRGDPEDELLKALEVADMTLISKLLNAIPSLANIPYSGGMTLLMLGNDLRVAKMALDAGAKIDAKDINGNTALHYAIYYRDLETAEFLLVRQANINAKNSFGNTPLHFATLMNNETLADFLMRHGADCTIKNGEGRTPMGIAMGN